jgi:hypothetical protein
MDFKNSRSSNLGVSGQNDIWVQAPWLDIENTMRGKVVASRKFVFARDSSVH